MIFDTDPPRHYWIIKFGFIWKIKLIQTLTKLESSWNTRGHSSDTWKRIDQSDVSQFLSISTPFSPPNKNICGCVTPPACRLGLALAVKFVFRFSNFCLVDWLLSFLFTVEFFFESIFMNVVILFNDESVADIRFSSRKYYGSLLLLAVLENNQGNERNSTSNQVWRVYSD